MIFSKVKKCLVRNTSYNDVHSKDQAEIQILAPCSGRLLKLGQVNDSAFSSGALGDGCAIIPDEDAQTITVVSPARGTVEALYPTGHALALRLEDGSCLLVHLGIDTVELQGSAFVKRVSQSEQVDSLQPLIEYDVKSVRDHGFDPCVILTLAEVADKAAISICTQGEVKQSELLAKVTVANNFQHSSICESK